jgi:hypothetical protein
VEAVRSSCITLGWRDAVLFDRSNVPYVAPEIQMLFESRDQRPKDDLDAATVLPALDLNRAGRLKEWLQPNMAASALNRGGSSPMSGERAPPTRWHGFAPTGGGRSTRSARRRIRSFRPTSRRVVFACAGRAHVSARRGADSVDRCERVTRAAPI